MGREAFQTHRVSCTKCGEDMVVGLRVDHQSISAVPEAIENCKRVPEVPEAPIINVDANFIIRESDRHKDRIFQRLEQQDELLEAAAKAHSITVDELLSRASHAPTANIDYSEEWKLLRKAWSLHRRGQEKLSTKRVAEASEQRYRRDPLKSLADWLFRFSMEIGQPAYHQKFVTAIEAIRPLLELPKFKDFLSDYSQQADERGLDILIL